MKKITTIFMAVIMMIGCFSGCGKTTVSDIDDNKIKIVTTIFPEYDWVMNILGDNRDNVEVTMLLDNGVDLHNYQPNAQDILKINTCDLFIYVGGESDEWVEDVLKTSTNKNFTTINLMDTLHDTLKEEETKEGMQEENEEEEGSEYDEHIWLSLKNAGAAVKAISESIQKIDPQNAEIYKNNTSAYIKNLKQLDKEYEDVVNSSTCRTLLFGDRFPFRYMIEDYGLEYYAAFKGCSAESEASFETINFLSGKINELGLKNIIVIDGNNETIAKAIIDNTDTKDQNILRMDSLQSTTLNDANAGVTYLEIMRNNLSVLKDALD